VWAGGGRDGAAGFLQPHLGTPTSPPSLDKCRQGGQPRRHFATAARPGGSSPRLMRLRWAGGLEMYQDVGWIFAR